MFKKIPGYVARRVSILFHWREDVQAEKASMNAETIQRGRDFLAGSSHESVTPDRDSPGHSTTHEYAQAEQKEVTR